MQVDAFWRIPPLTGDRNDGSVSIGGGSFKLEPDIWNDVQILLRLNSVDREVIADGVLQVRPPYFSVLTLLIVQILDLGVGPPGESAVIDIQHGVRRHNH
jgi:hypothetical protein